MLFSVIVPIYCVEAYLPTCVESVLGQSHRDFELILVDDGSPDACPVLCDAYAARDERVRVIHQPNAGLSAARNAGIHAAQGEYLLFLDADDFLSEDALAQISRFAELQCDILIGDGETIGAEYRMSHGNTAEILRGDAYLKCAIPRGAMPMAAVLYVYRRVFLLSEGLLFRCGVMHEDEDFTPRAFLRAERVIETGVSFYRYVVRESSLTNRRDFRKNAEDFYAICTSLCALYTSLPDEALSKILRDSLVSKYLSLFQRGRLYRYGKEYGKKAFLRENAFSRRNRRKVRLYCASPRLYWYVNHFLKRLQK